MKKGNYLLFGTVFRRSGHKRSFKNVNSPQPILPTPDRSHALNHEVGPREARELAPHFETNGVVSHVSSYGDD
jgi:hypothetical protein